MKKKLIIALLIGPLLGLMFASIHIGLIFKKEYQGVDTYFTIEPGEGFASINYRLSKEKLISNPRIFHYYVKYFSDSINKFKAGTYLIKNGDNMQTIFKNLVEGVPLLETVTIPEGKNIFEIAKILEDQQIVASQDFLKEITEAKYFYLLGLNDNHHNLEGYLFPETYKFAPKSNAATVVQAMINEFLKKTANLDFSKSPLTKHEVIILASIVEKETGAKIERPTIAGVFHNRLKKRMRLQSDPTTIYGLLPNFDGNLKKKHLLELTPYNTYKISRLPIGPISNPSLEAIKAVLDPEQHNYLYFVSKNDGTHIFSENYTKHRQAVEEWQKNPANRKNRSWRDLKQ